MAVCNANYEFIMIDVGAFGSQSDGGVFAASEFGKMLHNNTLSLPTPTPLYPGGERIPFCFVGDEAFPLKPNLLRPYAGRTQALPLEENVYNYRLSRARRTIENSFGILAARWRIFHTPIKTLQKYVDYIIQANKNITKIY